jgi:FkbM family methyltransferase
MPHLMHSPKCLIDRVRGHTFLPNCLNRTGKVVDLGMNNGDFAKVMRDRYGCFVAGLEANPLLAKATSKLSGILCKNAAISASDGFVEFLIIDEDPEASRIVARASRTDHTITVPSVSLSTFLREIDTEEVDLLKIDVEGAELDLIEEADPDDLLRCAQITIEFHSFIYPDQAPRVENAIAILSKLGFYYLDFSASWTDVLFINNRMIDLTTADKVLLFFQKYRNGLKRRFARLGAAEVNPSSHIPAQNAGFSER